MARITLETATRFTTLRDFFGKGPGLEGVPTDGRREILPGDGKDHRYAAASQGDVTT